MLILLALMFSLGAPEGGFCAPPAASDPLYDELEGAGLAEALLRDGKVQDARTLLGELPSRERRSAVAEKVRGELALLEGDPASAVTAYERGLSLEGESPELRSSLQLGLARASQRLGRHEACARAAQAAGDLVYRSETDLLLKAGCERMSGAPAAALSSLLSGRERGLGFGLMAEQLRLLLSLGLREQASRTVQEQILRTGSPSDMLAMAEILMEAGAKEESLLALESARLRFPADRDILLAIAPVYFARGLKRATAEAFSLAAVRDRAYAEHAAETLRQAGARQRSRYLNLFIPGEKERGRQKLALAVEGSRWDLVASMDSLVRRSSLEGDDEVSYALAYSLLRGGERERARSYLESVKSPSLLGKVTALLKGLESCAGKGWRCR